MAIVTTALLHRKVILLGFTPKPCTTWHGTVDRQVLYTLERDTRLVYMFALKVLALLSLCVL